MNQQEKLQLINEIFTPSSPVENKELFSGRLKELEQLKQTIAEKGQHAVLFGPRGAGKTSLANMAQYLYDNLLTIKTTCNRSDDFKTIWERALRKIQFLDQTVQTGYKPSVKSEFRPIDVPPVQEINPTEIENILSGLNINVLFVFDEYDIIRSAEVRSHMADMIKLLSDNLHHVTVLIVGISQSVDKLIGEHHSIERCIRQIELPLMNTKESKELITDNLSLIGLSVKKTILANIIDLSCGFPNYLHLLCKYAATESILNNQDEISTAGFNHAVRKSIDDSDYSIRNAYQKATGGSKEYADFLLACALASADHDNSFSVADVMHSYNKITGKSNQADNISQDLSSLCKREKAEILTKLGRSKNARFKFRKPLLKAYVKLKKYESTIN